MLTFYFFKIFTRIQFLTVPIARIAVDSFLSKQFSLILSIV